jgi:peptidyl-prolyl cis-trans isomerase SurA
MKLLGSFLLLAVGMGSAADARIVEQIIAKVNGEIVTSGEIEQTRKQLEAELRRQGMNGDQLEEAMKEREEHILRDQIDQLLLVQRGKDLSINVDAEVSKQLASIQLENKIDDPDKFQQWIREQSGMSYEDFRDQMKNSMLTRRVIGQEVSSRINIPRAEVEKYYEEHKDEFMREDRVFLREILISTEGKTGEELEAAEKKAKDVHERAQRGEKFGELARDNSDAVTARNYGELGSFTRGQLRKDIEDFVFNASRGDVTDLIKLDNGYLIIKVEERHSKGLASLDEVYNEVMEKLYMPQFQPAIRQFLTRLRQDAFLEIREGYVDSGAAPGKNTAWTDPAELKPETVTKEEVATQTRRRRLLWAVPIPGTSTDKKSSSSSR